MYIPPYSPDLNPIEEMWSKLKAYLRKEKARITGDLLRAVGDGLKTLSRAKLRRLGGTLRLCYTVRELNQTDVRRLESK
jgi:transposase